jgi:hypothetical protein
VSSSDYLEAAWLNTLRGGGNGVTFTAPAAIYAQLHIGDPTDVGTSNPATSTVRQAITFAAAVSGAGTMTSNTDAIWNPWGGTTTEQLTFFSLWDALTSGNNLGSGPLTATLQVNPNDYVNLRTGTVIWTLT